MHQGGRCGVSRLALLGRSILDSHVSMQGIDYSLLKQFSPAQGREGPLGQNDKHATGYLWNSLVLSYENDTVQHTRRVEPRAAKNSRARPLPTANIKPQKKTK